MDINEIARGLAALIDRAVKADNDFNAAMISLRRAGFDVSIAVELHTFIRRIDSAEADEEETPKPATDAAGLTEFDKKFLKGVNISFDPKEMH